jgi:hypothetical protein
LTLGLEHRPYREFVRRMNFVINDENFPKTLAKIFKFILKKNSIIYTPPPLKKRDKI